MGIVETDSLSFWEADVSQFYRLYGIELTGLKRPKTIGFRGTVQANIQSNGSSQMLMSCDCYPATDLTLFKGQMCVLHVCVRVSFSYVLLNRNTHTPLLTTHTQRLKIPALCPIVPITFQK